jgi:hypothetical protein
MVHLTIDVVNNSKQPLQRLLVRVRMPKGGLQHPQGDYIEAEIPRLAPGEKATVPLHAKAIRAGKMVTIVTILAEGAGEVSAQTSVQVVEARPLASFGSTSRGVAEGLPALVIPVSRKE